MESSRTSRPDGRARAAAARRLKRELKTVEKMIGLHCREQHQPKDGLCEPCAELWRYVQERIDLCPFSTDKPTCLNCTVHCFKPEKRETIRQVMRYAGPRMMRRHPLLTVLHLIDGRRPAPALAKPKARKRAG